jgi:sugar phosphate isomerase/epimerase
MLAGIFARTYASKDPTTLFAQIRRDGFATTQFNLSCAGLDPLPTELPDGLGQAIQTAAADAGVTLCALSGTYNMAHPDPGRRRASRVGFSKVVQAARDMGVSLVTLCTGSRDPVDMWRAHPDNTTPAALADLHEELDWALALAEAADVRLAIEPEPGNVIADARLARRLLDEVGTRRLGVILDAANLLPPEVLPRQAAIVAQAIDLLGEDLFLVHAKDIDGGGAVVAAGRGLVDLPAFVEKVRSTGYDGPLIGHGFTEAEAPDVGRYLSNLATGRLR